MSWFFEANSADKHKKDMWKEVVRNRRAFDMQEKHLSGLYGNAAAVIPQDVWREMDAITKKVLRNDEGDVLLQDLIPLARSLPVGKVIHQQRRASDAGVVSRSISGGPAEILDKTAYSYGKTVIPIFRAGYSREWREIEAQGSEGFDSLTDDTENVTQAVRKDWADYVRDGDANIVFDGQQGFGFTNSPEVVAFDLGAGGQNIDYTSGIETAQNIRNGFKEIRDALRITNNVIGPLTVYVSREIMSNFERYYSDNFSTGESITMQLLKLTGIADIKETALLVGNEMFFTWLNPMGIRPLIGMGISTFAIPRQTQLDDYNFVTWGAMGIQFQQDYDGRKSNLFASELT